VESIRQTTVKEAWTPLGTGASFDADSRAVTSYQIGPGLSNKGMVVLGAGGGATYRKSPGAYDQPRWEVTIKMDSGQKRVITVAYEPFVREGDRVRVAGKSLELVD
jgi:outer membrane lipoprotein SlyB